MPRRVGICLHVAIGVAMSDKLTQVHSRGIVKGAVGTLHTLQRIEGKCEPHTHTTQYVGRQGPGKTTDYNVTGCVNEDILWDICLHQMAYMSHTMGRYATGVGKGKAKPHETRQTHAKKEIAYNVGASRADKLGINGNNLKLWIHKLIRSRGETARTGIIQEIQDIVESTHGLEIPAFMSEPKNLVSTENAANTVSLMYSMFSLVSRDFKKYYLHPRIKKIRKTWKLQKQVDKPETMESLKQRILAQKMEIQQEPKKRINMETVRTWKYPGIAEKAQAAYMSAYVRQCEEEAATVPQVGKGGKPWLSVVHAVPSGTKEEE